MPDTATTNIVTELEAIAAQLDAIGERIASLLELQNDREARVRCDIGVYHMDPTTVAEIEPARHQIVSPPEGSFESAELVVRRNADDRRSSSIRLYSRVIPEVVS